MIDAPAQPIESQSMGKIERAQTRFHLLPAGKPPTSGQPQFDVILVHSVLDPSHGLARRQQLIAAKCKAVGIEVSETQSRDGDETLLKLSASDASLERVAEITHMDKELLQQPSDGPSERTYTDFLRAERLRFKPASSEQFFSSLERIRLLLALLELPAEDGGCAIHLQQEIDDGVLTAVVPIHEVSVSEGVLMDEWCRSSWRWFPSQPRDEVRDYFGEQIAFYFAFAQTISRSLVLPAIIGATWSVLAFVYYQEEPERVFDNPLMPLYSVFMLLWIFAVCKLWRREEARLAHRWNVEDFRAIERPRPAFNGHEERGFYSPEGYWVGIEDDEPYAHHTALTKKFTTMERLHRTVISYAFILPMLISTVVATSGLLAYKSLLILSFYLTVENEYGSNVSGRYGVIAGALLGGALNGVFISLTNAIYSRVAYKLNEYENHRTASAFDDALILKTFLFQFINSYVSLFYVAFARPSHLKILPLGTPEYCHDYSHYGDPESKIKAENGGLNPYCMQALSIQLASLAITSQFTGLLLEYAVPRLKAASRIIMQEATMRAQRMDIDVGAPTASSVDTPVCGSHIVHLISGAARSLLRFHRDGRKGYSISSSQTSMNVSDAHGMLPPLSFYEEQCKLEPFGGTYSEYNRLIIQVGYVVLFAPAFPFAATLCYLSFQIEMRADAYKLLVNTQRPRYLGAQGIGSWQKVLWLLGVIAVLTNLGVIAHTSVAFNRLLPFEVVEGWKINERNKTFFLFLCEHIVLAAQYIVFVALPDFPMDLAIKRARQRWRVRVARVAHAPRTAEAQQWDEDELLVKYALPIPMPEADGIATDEDAVPDKRLLYI